MTRRPSIAAALDHEVSFMRIIVLPNPPQACLREGDRRRVAAVVEEDCATLDPHAHAP
jgi:hypothetical protein